MEDIKQAYIRDPRHFATFVTAKTLSKVAAGRHLAEKKITRRDKVDRDKEAAYANAPYPYPLIPKTPAHKNPPGTKKADTEKNLHL